MSLYERIAAVMPRWKHQNHHLVYRGVVRFPDMYFDDARPIVDRAVEVCGFDAYGTSLHDLVNAISGASMHHNEPVMYCRPMILATAAQQTEAAVRCLEAHSKGTP